MIVQLGVFPKSRIRTALHSGAQVLTGYVLVMTCSPEFLSQIKSKLQDRYASGFPILKELLQNADNSCSRTICVDTLPG
jgi:hypothetical protein